MSFVNFHAKNLLFFFIYIFLYKKMMMKRKIYFLCGMFIITALFTLSFIILKSKSHNDIFRANVEKLQTSTIRAYYASLCRIGMP